MNLIAQLEKEEMDRLSAGKTLPFAGETLTVQELTETSFQGVDVALFSAGGSISKKYAPIAVQSGAVVVDNSSAFRLDAERDEVRIAVAPPEVRDAARRLCQPVGRDRSEADATVAFSPQQQACLEQLSPSLNGRTRKQQNPYPPYSLAWAAWLIARLGGWSGYQSQRPPGIITFYRGLQTFEGIFLGWKLVHLPGS